MIELYNTLVSLIPNQLQTLKLDYNAFTRECISDPPYFLIANYNHVRLDLTITAELNHCIEVAAKLLVYRHLKANEDRYGFI